MLITSFPFEISVAQLAACCFALAAADGLPDS
jgi:hypothetical protein